MKKSIFIFLLSLLITSTVFASSSTRTKAINKYIAQNNLTVLVASGDYTLTCDKNSTFFLFDENWLFDEIYIYTESGKVEKNYVADKMETASSAKKVIEKSGYTVYEVYMGFLSDTYYFVKTPKGNFYSVSKKVKTLGSGSTLADEL